MRTLKHAIFGLLLAAAAFLAPLDARGQNVICPTAPLGTSDNRCASTQFVQNQLAVGVPIAVGITTITGGTSGRVVYDNAGVVGEYTQTQLTAQINVATSSLTGALPAFPGNTTTFFRGDGTYATLNCNALASVGSACSANTGTSGHTLPFLDTVNTWSAQQIINLNASAAPTPATGTGLQLVGTDATIARVEADSFGAIAAFTSRRANGTGAAPTALAANDQIGAFNFHGYYVTGGPAYSGVQANVSGYAAQAWTSTTLGTYVDVRTTPNGSTTLGTVARFGNDGSIIIPTTVTGGSQGAGTINASGLYVNGVAVTGAGITALTGDVTATGPGSVAATLATVNAGPGSVGSSTAIPVFTTNGKGLVTTQTTAAVVAPAGTLTGATLASNVLASSLTSVGTLTGGATGAGFTVALGTSTITGQLALANGGTAANLTASNGGLVYSTGSALAILSGTATANQIPLSGSSAAPSWSTATYPSTAAAGTVLAAGSSNVIAGTITPTLGVQQTSQGKVILANTAAGAFPATVQSSNSATAATTITLPVDAGTNGFFLSTNGAGVTSWVASAGSGTVTSVGFTGGLISVATATTTPALTVAGTSGGVPYFSSSSTWASSGALAANALVIGGGAGAAPATTTTGTGILTALGVNTGTAGAPAILIASGTSAMGTGAISSATCATVVTTSATGTATTDALIASFNGDPTAVTGYVPLTTGMLTIIGYPTANNVNWKVCNNTSASITPGAITLNWRVVR